MRTNQWDERNECVSRDRPPCVLLGQSFREHAGRSGYIRLAAAMPEAEVVLVDQDPPTAMMSRGLVWLARQGAATRWVSYAGLRLEKAAVSRMLARPNRTLFHLLYGHPGYAWAARWARRTGHLCVATFHEPASLAAEINRRPEHLNLLDGIVVVGSSQREYFREHLHDPEKVFVVPHGIDVEYFTPINRRPSETVTCLAVGSFMRNFDLLAQTADALAGEHNVRFVVVAPSSKAGPLAGRDNVTLAGGLTDEELRETYRAADLFLLAAHDVTANNALLEAMACGLPVLSEEVGSVRDYIGTDNAVLCPPNDVQAMVRTIRALATRPAARMRMAEASRRRAVHLSWPKIANQVREVYREVTERSAVNGCRASRTISLVRRAVDRLRPHVTSVEPSA